MLNAMVEFIDSAASQHMVVPSRSGNRWHTSCKLRGRSRFAFGHLVLQPTHAPLPRYRSHSASGLLSPDHPCWDDQVAPRWPLIRMPRWVG
jgi:hypothetical protein